MRGLQDGLWERYHANGVLLDRGLYVLRKKVGEWVSFDATGEQKRVTHHREVH